MYQRSKQVRACVHVLVCKLQLVYKFLHTILSIAVWTRVKLQLSCDQHQMPIWVECLQHGVERMPHTLQKLDVEKKVALCTSSVAYQGGRKQQFQINYDLVVRAPVWHALTCTR